MMKLKKLLFLGLLVLLPALLIGCTSTESGYKVNNAYITIDINPSVEIITGEDGKVAQVNALNEDAQVLLVDTNFVGMTVDEVTTAIVDLAVQMGYIDFASENAIVITAEAGDDTEELHQTLAEKVNAFVSKRQIKLEVVEASFAATEDMKALASQLGISIGKLKLITFAMAYDVDLTVNAGAQMSVKDLNRIVMQSRREVHEFYNEEFRASYTKLQQELQIKFSKDKISLINDAIQNAEIEAFAELDIDEAKVTEVKALYLAYLDEVLAISLEENVDNTENPNQDVINESIARLQNQKNNLKEQLDNVLTNIEENIENEQVKKLLQDKIEEIREKIEDIDEEIEESIEDLEDNDDFRKKFKWIHKGFNPYYNLKQLNEKYEDLFEDINVDFEDLEELFEDELEDQIKELRVTYNVELEATKDQYKEQAVILKDQLIKEKETLKRIWKK